MFQTGLTSRPLQLEYETGDALLAISFKPGVFVTRTPWIQMLDRALVRPLLSAHAFAMDNAPLEVPTCENAAQLVEPLVRYELLVCDRLVQSLAEGRPHATTARSMQRHFLTAMGMILKQFAQIKRACCARDLLRSGMGSAAVALEAGYADQPHLTRSLKAIMGRTPGELLRSSAA